MKRLSRLLSALVLGSTMLACGGAATPTKDTSTGTKGTSNDDDDDDDDSGGAFPDSVVEVSWDSYTRTDVKAFRLYFGAEGASAAEQKPLGEIAVPSPGFDLNAPLALFPTSDDEELAKRLGKTTCITIVAVGLDNSESPASTPKCVDLQP